MWGKVASRREGERGILSSVFHFGLTLFHSSSKRTSEQQQQQQKTNIYQYQSRMSSLTPQSRSAEAVSEATYEGCWNGLLTLIPTAAAVGLALRTYPAFRQRTNWQSRTALTIMPAMFVAALTSELHLSHKMRAMAVETQHSTETVHWAEDQWKQQQQQQQSSTNSHSPYASMNETQHLSALYQQAIESSGIRVVPELQWYHKAANYTAQNPIKILAAVAVPTVGYIFYGRNDQAHLQFSSKIMQTRVMGQFATISALLGIMGFKEFMDRNGRYVSQQQAEERVQEMQRVRQQLLLRLQDEQHHVADRKRELKQAHEQDVQEHNGTGSSSSKTKTKKNNVKKLGHDDDDEQGIALDAIATMAPKE